MALVMAMPQELLEAGVLIMLIVLGCQWSKVGSWACGKDNEKEIFTSFKEATPSRKLNIVDEYVHNI